MGKGAIEMKECSETHQQGLISIDQNLITGGLMGDFGIQIAKDGRIWICINGISAIRFKPTIDFGIKEDYDIKQDNKA